MLIASQQFRPLPVIVLGHYSTSDHRAGHIVLRRFGHHISREELPFAIFCQVPDQQHLRIASKQMLRRILNIIGNRRLRVAFA